jgi:hypothetical protein
MLSVKGEESMRTIKVAFSVLVFLVISICTLGLRTLSAAEIQEMSQLSGCICGLDSAVKQLNIVRWNADSKSYDFEDAVRLSYDDQTKIGVPGVALAQSDLRNGKSLLLKNPSTGKTEAIADPSELERYRAHLKWTMREKERVIIEIELVNAFDGETIFPVEDPGSPTGWAYNRKCPCRKQQ